MKSLPIIFSSLLLLLPGNLFAESEHPLQNRQVNYNYETSKDSLKRASRSTNSSSPATPFLIEKFGSRFVNPEVLVNYGDAVDYVYSLEDTTDSDKMCRQQTHLPQPLFNLHSCAYCYHYMRDDVDVTMFGRPSRKWEKRTTLWKMETDGREWQVAVLGQKKQTTTVFANVRNPPSELLSSFPGEHERQKWVDCCQAAERCCEQIGVSSSQLPALSSSGESDACVATWDGWQCWNTTDRGTTAHARCPNYIYFVMREAPSCTVMAEKSCESNGTWTRRKGAEWTNYASCAAAVIEAQKRRNYVHVLAYLVSIVTIIPALIVFFAYKQLRVHRIILHQNFLFSMLINGLLVVAFKTIVIISELRGDSHVNSISNQNGIACRFLLILTKYSRMTNYMWMFCESFYLHRLIAAAFAEQKSLLVFYIIGWVFPIIPTVLYGGFRLAWANEKCWIEPVESLEWILNVPSLLSLLINMLFLINIIRVLLTKLRANSTHANNEHGQFRKAVKATLILLPLFGLHFVVTIYRPSSASGTCEWTEVYYIVNDVLDGLQGFLVALIFCYLNGEVILLFKRTYSRWREARSSAGSGGCLRQPSGPGGVRPRGSMLGRSIVSTQCYSSVPASPETVTRLALNVPMPGALKKSPCGSQDVISNGGSSKSLLCPVDKSSCANSASNSPSNSLLNDTIVQIKNNDTNNGTWTEVKLGNGQSECHELKNLKIGQVNCNGTGEHQL